MASDTHFNDLADWFATEIYGSSWGYIRLNVLWRDLLAALPELQQGGLDILDAGGGMGQLSQRLAGLGHRITLADPSAEMLERARSAFAEAGLSERVAFIHSDIQGLPLARYDVVLNHAVLEWLAEPQQTLKALLDCVKPSGVLSLMFHNRNASVLKRVLETDFAKARALVRGERLDDDVPLDPNEVQGWLESLHFAVASRSGIRMFHDHVPKGLRTPEKLRELLELEFELRQTEPFASLAQHIHLVARAA